MAFKKNLAIAVLLFGLSAIAGSCDGIGSTQKTYSLQYKVFTTAVGVQPSFSVSIKNKQQVEQLIGPITTTFWFSELMEEVPDEFVANISVARIQNDEIPLTLEILRDGAVHATIVLKSYEQEIEIEKEL